MNKLQIDENRIPIFVPNWDDPMDIEFNKFSLVQDPAIDVKGVKLKKHNINLHKVSFQTQISCTNLKEQQKIAAPILLWGKPMLQIDEDGNPWFLLLRKEDMPRMYKLYNSDPANTINFNHSEVYPPVTLEDNWLVSQPNDESESYGFIGDTLLKDDDWFGIVKVEDVKFWNQQVKEDGFYSFSIECQKFPLINLEHINLSKAKLESIYNDLEQLNENEFEEFTLTFSKIINAAKKDPKAKVRNRGKVVFPAGSSKIKDDKDHFPINSAAQARNALSRAGQYKSVPTWYKGSLTELKDAIKHRVKSEYPSIEVTE
jgi:hypothetical protein